MLIAVNVFGDEREIQPAALENMRSILNLNAMWAKLHFIKFLCKGKFLDMFRITRFIQPVILVFSMAKKPGNLYGACILLYNCSND